jgi:hypothetical protein
MGADLRSGYPLADAVVGRKERCHGSSSRVIDILCSESQGPRATCTLTEAVCYLVAERAISSWLAGAQPAQL